MRENRLRTLWREDKAAVNGWLAVPNSFSAEVMAHQGWDTLTIDMQHGVIDYAAMVTMLQAISTTPTVPVVRVPWLEPGIIMKSAGRRRLRRDLPDGEHARGRAEAGGLHATTHRAARAASARCAPRCTAGPTMRSMPTTPSSPSR